MISLRRHVLTIVAIFLALAVGLVLGVSTSGASGQRDEPGDELDSMARALGPAVTDGALDDRPVLLLQAPGTEIEDVDAVAGAVSAAGGLDAGRIRLTEKSLAPDAAGELETLVADLPTGDAAPADDAGPGTLLGLALSRAAMLDPATSETYLSDDERGDVMTTLADAGYVDYERGTLRAGTLAVIVAGSDGGVHGDAGDQIAWLARQFDSDSSGTVVAARASEEGADGPVEALRGLGDTGVTTVDNVATDSGRLAVVLGLAEQLDGGAGAYGLQPHADAVVPDADGS